MNDKYLYLDRILWPVTALGPGNRIAIWVSGCSRGCRNCANPELWKQNSGQKISVSKLADILNHLKKEKNIEGLTISGGEPFDQAVSLTELLEQTVPFSDILIYSGYLKEEILEDPAKRRLLEMADVLIDGPYIEEENEDSVVLRGSANQRIWYLDRKKEECYLAYMKKGRQIQNFVYEYQILSVGIHSRMKSKESESRREK